MTIWTCCTVVINWLETVAPPGFCNRGEVRYGSIGGLEYEVPQSRLYCLYINVALCSTALQCICRVIRRCSMTMKAHTYYIIFGHPPIRGSFPLPPWRRHWLEIVFPLGDSVSQVLLYYSIGYIYISLLCKIILQITHDRLIINASYDPMPFLRR